MDEKIEMEKKMQTCSLERVHWRDIELAQPWCLRECEGEELMGQEMQR